jgi:hypothetical protein
MAGQQPEKQMLKLHLQTNFLMLFFIISMKDPIHFSSSSILHKIYNIPLSWAG